MKGKFTSNAFSFMKIAVPVAFLMLVLTDCKKDPEPLAREKFLGTYTVNENCASGNYTYDITITASGSNENDVIVNGLGTFTYNFTGTVSGSSISINSTQQGLTLSATGSLSGTALTIVYTFSGAFDDNCTATAIKR